MIVNSNSGGGAYIAFLGVASALAAKKYGNFDAFTGVSSGMYTSLIHAVKGPDFVLEYAPKISPTKIYKKILVTPKGGIKFGGWMNAISKGYLMEQDARPLLREMISVKEWNDYRNSNYTPPVFCVYYNATDGVNEVENLKDYCFEDALYLAEASAHIPCNTSPVEINGSLCWDGGQKDHQPSSVLFDQFGSDVNTLVSIWSRPEKWKLEKWKPKKVTFFKTLSRVLESYNHETSLNDEFKELVLCKEHNTKRIGIYNEKRILGNVYDYNKENLDILIQHAKEQV